MLSYRHAFHAGNAADVLKHSILIFCLEYLARKEKPLLCVDTHAGAGGYRLNEGYAAQKREWETGVGRLPALESPPPLLRRYLEICFPAETGDAPAEYPGSPAIMARLLRPADRLVCFELHPADYAACAALLADRAEVRRADGFAGLTSLLPPPSRRGLVLIDPPYEVKEDYARVSGAAARALRRFATGTYLIWYPLLRNPPAGAAGLPARLLEQYNGSRCRVELYTAAPNAPPENSPRGMYGSGLAIYNPPWTLKAALEESLPTLAAIMGRGNGGWKIEHDQ